MGRLLELQVDCYAGHRGEETPRRFWLRDKEIAVAEVLDRWHGPDHRYFKVRCASGETYILRHDERDDRWELTLFDSRAG